MIGVTLLIALLISSCSDSATPKPRGHFRIDLPDKGYISYDSICPFTFEYPNYGVIAKEKGAMEPCWFNIEFPEYKGKIHLSYKAVDNNIDLLIEDSHKLAYKHSVKADAIEESYWENREKRVYGTVYLISGNAASSIQFYVTDSVENYLRGSLYFATTPNKDSLAPVIDFFRRDVIHLVETLEWK
jgi:gliding motility-associated lipoprotein GldD